MDAEDATAEVQAKTEKVMVKVEKIERLETVALSNIHLGRSAADKDDDGFGHLEIDGLT